MIPPSPVGIPAWRFPRRMDRPPQRGPGSATPARWWTCPTGGDDRRGNTLTPSITAPRAAALKAEVVGHLKPLDRFMVQGIPPLALEEAGVVALQFTVRTSNGKDYSDMVEVDVTPPFTTSPGLRNVPVGEPVLSHGATQASDMTGCPPLRRGPAHPSTPRPTGTPLHAGRRRTRSQTGGGRDMPRSPTATSIRAHTMGPIASRATPSASTRRSPTMARSRAEARSASRATTPGTAPTTMPSETRPATPSRT